MLNAMKKCVLISSYYNKSAIKHYISSSSGIVFGNLNYKAQFCVYVCAGA